MRVGMRVSGLSRSLARSPIKIDVRWSEAKKREIEREKLAFCGAICKRRRRLG